MPTKITFDHGDCIETRKDVADALVMNGNLRFATMDGDSESAGSAEITKIQSDEPVKVKIKNEETGEKEQFNEVHYLNTSDGQIYVASPSSMDKLRGEIVRARRLRLQ